MSESIVVAEQKKLETTLAGLKTMAASIVVSTPESCLTAKTAQRDVRNYLKDVHAKLDPFVNAAKAAYDKAKDERTRWIEPAETIDAQLAAKVKDFEQREREAAEAEQRRINEERRRKAEADAAAQRKADEEAAAERRRKEQADIEAARKAGELKKREAEKLKKEAEERERAAKEQAAMDEQFRKTNVQDVTVKPNIPTVSGVPSRRNWKFEVVNVDRIPRSFMCPDLVEIGGMVRSTKDKAKAEAACPGIRVWEE